MTVVILAGGQSRRMGRDKLRLRLEGEELLQRAVRRWTAVFPRVLVSVADADAFPWLGDARIADEYPGQGPMAGLQAGLRRAGESVFLTAADMPFASPAAALRMRALWTPETDACVLTDDQGRWEPLFGLYAPSVLPLAESLLDRGRRSMGGLLDRCRVRVLKPEDLGESGDGRLLLNLNEPGEYEKLRLELGE